MRHALSPPPAEVLDASGTPLFGTYSGPFGTVDLSRRFGTGIRAAAQRFIARKHWVYATVATSDVLVACAVVDLGYGCNAFAFAVDLARGETLASISTVGVPGRSASIAPRPADGLDARFSQGATKVHLSRAPDGRFRLEVDTKELEIKAFLNTSPTPTLAAILPLTGGDLDVTQKWNLLPSEGEVRAAGRTFGLVGGFGGLDYTQGLFARHTAWRWGFGLGRTADGTPVGLNLTHGLSDAAKNENALWIGETMHVVAPPRFVFDPADHLKPWEVTTADGAVALRFSPAGQHREHRNLGLMRSRFTQVAGRFEGRICDTSGRTHEVSIPGVVEDQSVTW